MAGNFVITPTGNNFSAVPTDQALEQSLNKDSKTAGGIIGSSNNVESRSKWFMTSHIRAQMLSTAHEMCGQDNLRTVKHREDRPTYTAKDERDVQAVICLFRQFNTNPFNTTDPVLVNVATGLSPGPDIIQKIITAPLKGAEKCSKFIHERLLEQNVLFHSSLAKTNTPQFSTVTDNSTLVKKRKKIDQGKSTLTRLVIMSKDRNFNVRELLKYETGSIPLALFDSNGNYRKTKKSDLMKILVDDYSEGQVVVIDQLQSKAIIIDGMVMVQSTSAKSSACQTFGEFSDLLFERIMKEAADYAGIHVVFDVYNQLSIKCSESTNRGPTTLASYQITQYLMKLARNWQGFLSSINNKNELVRFLINLVDFEQCSARFLNLIVVYALPHDKPPSISCDVFFWRPVDF